MLVILSEINCLKLLNDMGVYPDLFYTDFDAFKTGTFLYDHANVIILFAGNNRFTKRLVMEQIILLSKRAENENDNSIDNLFVVSDIQFNSLSQYYMYTHDLSHIYLYEKTKQKDEVEFWEMFKTAPKKSEVKLSKYDMGDSSDAYSRFKNRRASSEDEYLDLIIVPERSSLKRQKTIK